MDRRGEWFVPTFGPERLRIGIGLLFLPYTGMVLAFTVIGSMLAPLIHWDRVAAIVVIYFLALGVGAHALDALGSRGPKPWGEVFSRPRLWIIAVVSIAAAYAIGTWYMVLYTPWLWAIAIPEGFFLLAYNLEWFGGRFHTDAWFAVSWGALPVLAGYVLQANAVSASVLLMALAMALFSLVEIKASRPYKELKRSGVTQAREARALEAILKSISLGVIVLAAALLAYRAWS